MNTDKFLALTSHLTLEQKGAAITFYCWMKSWEGHPAELDDEDAQKLLGVTGEGLKRYMGKPSGCPMSVACRMLEDEGDQS